ncbi:MAG TPA: AAA family ATPase [Solirubrobacteraceae bacterium]|nr:AAA family ATPase [Solirubrobacteraceae bacterium]
MELGGLAAEPVPRVVGRDAELAVLDAHLAAACAGAGRFVVLEGPAGIGKSALLAAVRTGAGRHGARWLHAVGSELEGDFAFGVVRQLLEPVAAHGDPDLLSGAAGLARTAFEAPDAAPAADLGFGVLHGLFWLVANLAERGPVVICVDDVQWADAPSLRFLDYLALRLEGLPVLGALAARAGEATLTVGPIARLLGHPDVHELEVGPLDSGAVAALVRAELGAEAPEPVVTACHEVTGGNPFLVRELAGELRRGGAPADPALLRQLAPPAIVRSLRLRLEALHPDAVALAGALAVLGDETAVSAAADLAGLDPLGAEAAAELLADAGILARGRPLRFVHPVVRSAARESVPAPDRDRLHRRAAAIAAAAPDGLDAAAGHLLAVAAAGDAAAVDLLRRAAAVARRRGAADVAARYLRRALAEPPPAEDHAAVLVELAGAGGLAGDPDAAVFAERAIAEAADPQLRLTAATEAAVLRTVAGRYDEAAAVLAAALAAPGLPVRRRTAAEALLLLLAVQSAGARRDHRGRVDAVVERAEELGADAPAPLLVLAGFERTLVRGEPARGADLVQTAIAGGRLLRETTADSPFPFIAATALIVAGRYDVAEATLRDLAAEAAREGSLRAFGAATGQRGLCRFRAGRLAAAEADARAALDTPRPSLVQLGMAGVVLSGVLIERGELDAAEAALAAVPADAVRADTHPGVVVIEARVRLRLAQGRWREALVDLEACAEWERRFDVRDGGWVCWRSLAAEARLAAGEAEHARALAEEGLELARRLGIPRALGQALRIAARAAPDPERRLALLEEAVDVLGRGGVAVEHARAAAALGAEHAAARRADAARATLGEALDLAGRCGATRLEQAARDALIALGARPRRSRATGAAALTPAERRVAELAAGGASNRDIAEQLFLTAKTVENHLTSTYRKLGIASRTQLAQRLG